MSTPTEESQGLYTAEIEQLVAIGAAIACNSDVLFSRHLRNALDRGISRGDVAQAVATARRVKMDAAERILKTAGEQLAAAGETGPQPGACCCSGRLPSNKQS
ncbi:MAG: hypothetical protein ABFC96_16815 [Thermoguttaceae bacterium]